MVIHYDKIVCKILQLTIGERGRESDQQERGTTTTWAQRGWEGEQDKSGDGPTKQ